MNQPSFNVLHEPWIPVVRLDGPQEELGILHCLLRAHELREIRDPSPIIEFGLYRLLVAFVLDALITSDQRPADALDLKKLIGEAAFNNDLLTKYIEACGDVFDLFDIHRPFLQNAGSKGNVKPISGAYPAIPSGTNAGLWHHAHERDAAVSPAGAARLLTTMAPFMTAGGAGLSPSINGAPAIYCLPLGTNLYQTILMNLLTGGDESGAGQVAWREQRQPGTERNHATTVEALTWRPRNVRVIPQPTKDGTIVVREMNFEKGDSTRLEWRDPNLAYRYDKEKVTPIRMREGRPLWRDAGPLALLHKGEHGKGDEKVFYARPSAVDNAFALRDPLGDLRIKTYGIRTDMKMKVFEWTSSELVFPSKLGRSTSLGRIVQAEIDRADKAAYSIRTALKMLYPREGAGNKAAMRTIGDRAERAYWQRLETAFHPLMARFAGLGEEAPSDIAVIDTAAQPWRSEIRELAEMQFELAARDMDADSDALERVVRARGRLGNSLTRALE